MTTSQERVQHVLDYAGLEAEGTLTRLPGRTYENWRYGDHVIRINPYPKHRELVREYALMRKLPPEASSPGVQLYGVNKNAEWLIMHYRPGVPLSKAWPELDSDQRHRAIVRLGEILRAVHHTPPPPELDSVYAMAMQLKKLQETIQQAYTLAYIDPMVLESASAFLRKHAMAFSRRQPYGIIHGDVHFDNLLWDGTTVTAIIGFKHARKSALDRELDVLFRFLQYPHLYSDYSSKLPLPLRAGEVVRWLQETYPALFKNDDLATRLDIYSLACDLPLLLATPPPGRHASGHPYQRVQAVLNGKGPRQFLE